MPTKVEEIKPIYGGLLDEAHCQKCDKQRKFIFVCYSAWFRRNLYKCETCGQTIMRE